MNENEIKLVRLENFTIELDGEKLAEGVFSWSGNYIVKLKVDAENKKVYVNLYYANKDYRINKKNKKKEDKKDEAQKIEEIFVK